MNAGTWLIDLLRSKHPQEPDVPAPVPTGEIKYKVIHTCGGWSRKVPSVYKKHQKVYEITPDKNGFAEISVYNKKVIIRVIRGEG
jgi:hypothetical protein